MNTKQKAAKLLGYDIKRIKKATVHTDLGTCSVLLTNGMPVTIPYQVWSLGWTEEEYIERKYKK